MRVLHAELMRLIIDVGRRTPRAPELAAGLPRQVGGEIADVVADVPRGVANVSRGFARPGGLCWNWQRFDRFGWQWPLGISSELM